MPSSSLEENLKIFPRTHACIMQLFEQLMSPGKISLMFYEQFLRTQIPKGQKYTDDLTVFLRL